MGAVQLACVLIVLGANAVLGIWQIIGALIDAAHAQEINEEHHAKEIITR